MLCVQLCDAVYADVARRCADYIWDEHSSTCERDTDMTRISITQTILTCAGILALLGYVAYYGAMNNI